MGDQFLKADADWLVRVLNDSRLSDHTLLEIQTRLSKKCKHFSEFRRTMKAEAPDLEDLNKYDF